MPECFFHDLDLANEVKKLACMSDDAYCNIIPNEMKSEHLNKIYYDVFGVQAMEMYLSRRIADIQSLIITEFATNGFFWGQLADENQMEEYKELYMKINDAERIRSLPPANPKTDRKCIANFGDEWFRGYIESVSADGSQASVFFVDYGTSTMLDLSATRSLNDEDIWVVGPLAVPFILKDLTLSKLNRFKELQYESFAVTSLKAIKKNCVFEVELADATSGKSLVEVL